MTLPVRPGTISTREELAAALRALRETKGHSYRDLERLTKGRLSRSTLSDTLTGHTLPTEETLRVLLRAYGQPETEHELWLRALSRVRSASRVELSRSGPAHMEVARGSARAEGEFVGRLDETYRLQGLLAESAAGNSTTVMLSGEAGVGKTRLLQEFARWAGATGALVLTGSCIDLGGGAISFAPLIEALRRLVHERGEPAMRRMGGRPWQQLWALFSGGGPETADSVGSPQGAAGVLMSVLRLLDTLAQTAPVVLIFEDMHWADQSTLDLVSYLTRSGSAARTLLLASYRSNLPPEHALRVLLAEPDFRRRIDQFELAPFTEGELRSFLRGLGQVNPDVLRRAFELSDGNAFMAEQLMRSGALTGSGGSAIPASISELMLGRLRRLSPEAVRVMRVVAAAAHRISDPLVAQATQLDDRALDEALRECLDAGMLVADPDDDTYAIYHALMREAVYESMIPRERRRLHTLMAETMAVEGTATPGSGGATPAGAALADIVELAHHWFRAGRNPEALATAVRAGRVSSRMHAFHGAETHYTRALGLWTLVADPEQVAGMPLSELLAATADAARWAGHPEHAIRHMQEALDLVDESAEPQRSGALLERLGSYEWECGNPEASRRAYTRAALLLVTQPPTAVKSRVLAGLAGAELRAGNFTEGLEQSRRAVAVAQQAGSAARPEHGRALSIEGVALTLLGQAGVGVERLLQAKNIAEERDDLEDLLRSYGNLSLALESSGRAREAADMALEGLDKARRLGLINARHARVLANNAGAALFLLGRWDEATALLEEVLADRPPVRESAYERLTLAEIYVARGRAEAAQELLDELSALSGDADGGYSTSVAACEAELRLVLRDPAAALEHAERGLVAAEGTQNELGRLRLCAIALRAAADHDAAVGESAEDGRAHRLARGAALAARAEAAANDGAELREGEALRRLCAAEHVRQLGMDTSAGWAGVAELWGSLDRPYHMAYARWREASALAAAGDSAAARNTASAAYEIARDLGAEPLARELDELVRETEHMSAGAERAIDAVIELAAERGLTPRETEVLRRLAHGQNNLQISRELSIAPATVGVHVSNLLGKLAVRTRTEAALMARRLQRPDS